MDYFVYGPVSKIKYLEIDMPLRIYKIVLRTILFVESLLVVFLIASKIVKGKTFQYGVDIDASSTAWILHPILYYSEVTMIIFSGIWLLLFIVLLFTIKINFISLNTISGLAAIVFCIVFYEVDPFGIDAYY